MSDYPLTICLTTPLITAPASYLANPAITPTICLTTPLTTSLTTLYLYFCFRISKTQLSQILQQFKREGGEIGRQWRTI
jgi:hypothetical protein